jgi:tetratricopeptide (TPR) repeat protein
LSMQKLQLSSTRDIQRAIWIVLAALIASLVLFGGYYYWDRYVHLGDRSPLELDIERMEAAVRQNPQDIDARVMLARYYLEEGMHREALDQTNQVLSLSPRHEGALLICGIAHVRMNRPEDALDPLERLIALRQEKPMADRDTTLETAYYFLGESYVKLNRPAEAIPALEAALAISPIDADALYQLGLAYQASGQPQVALEHYQRAVRLVPDFTEAYSSMLESYSTLEWPDYVIYAAGMEAFCLQDYETARGYLESATQALPDFAPAFLGLGLAYEKNGDLETALTAIQRALELDPSDYAAQHAHGRIQAALNSRN